MLIQQSANLARQNRSKPLAYAIDSKLTALGKDERAIAASPYVYAGDIKFTEPAFAKITVHKQQSANHLIKQVTGFRIGSKERGRQRPSRLLHLFSHLHARFGRKRGDMNKLRAAAASAAIAGLMIDESLLPANPTDEHRERLERLHGETVKALARNSRRDELSAFNATVNNRQARRAARKNIKCNLGNALAATG